MKKTFLDLKIGDIIYKVETDSYKSRIGPQLSKIKVFILGVENNKDFIVNKHYGYSNCTYLINKPISELDCDVLDSGDSLLTINKECVNNCLKEAGMEAIKYYEKEIENNKKCIENVRKAYFEYLNYR